MWRWLRDRVRGSVTRDGRASGRDAERRAAEHLQRQGYRVLARNLRLRGGEIDILAVAPDGRTLVIVEVKSGVANAAGYRPEQHVDRRKQRQLARLAVSAARRFAMTRCPIRFDVIAVEYGEGDAVTLRHHVGAFQSHV